MIGYIKSHSNYRLQERHQLVNDGTIFERDISTVGGANTFGKGLATVYQSGNFVIVVNNASAPSRHIRKTGWLASGYNSDVWDEAVLSQHSSDVYGSVESQITPKNDFMDFRSFSYYGSLFSLIENSVSKILTTYPYEIYATNSIDKINVDNVNFVIPDDDFYEVENPGNIDIYNVNSLDNVVYDELGHFFNGGIDNYALYYDNNTEPISGNELTWCVDVVSRYRCVINSGDIKRGDTISISGNTWYVSDVVTSDKKYAFLECFASGDTTISKDGITTGNVYYNDAVKLTGPCKNMFFSIVTVGTNIDDVDYKYQIYCYWDDKLNVKYLLKESETNENISIHIRPRMDLWFYDDFVDGLDMFGKCLVGEFSGIKNTANFEVLSEGTEKTERTAQTFVFPTTNGLYNLESSGFRLANYISSLGKIGNYYDNEYTDNLYRMMTHDSLKNLDWTKGFNGEEEYDNQYVKTGEKFSALIRTIGYAFDQERAYIDTIGNGNTITYSGRNNLSDYFLTDSLETDGWVVNTIYPYELTEYSANTSGKYVDVTNNDVWSMSAQTLNLYNRKFSEDTATIILPYFGGPNAHYEYCSGDEIVKLRIPNESYNGQLYRIVDGKPINVVKDYNVQSQVTIPTINNEFMKRLCINSKHILRKKGTIESIESVLSLFGLKSKRWAESCNKTDFDFDVEEYTSFSAPIVDEYDTQHNEYKINWYNSCKTIPYQTQSYLNGEYINYQGLPVAYRDVESSGNQTVRKLYPYFSSNGIYDGDMYYQMNGGWMNYFPYRFDESDRMFNYSIDESDELLTWPKRAAKADDLGKLYKNNSVIKLTSCNLIGCNCLVDRASVPGQPGEMAEVTTNIKFVSKAGSYPKNSLVICVQNGSSYAWQIFPLIFYGYNNYKETLRNVGAVNNIKDLLSQPVGDLENDMIFYVTDIRGEFALINGYPYEIKKTTISGETERYFECQIYDSSVSVGGDLYTDVLTVSDPNGISGFSSYNLDLYADGSTIRVYYTGDEENAFSISATTSDGTLTTETSYIFSGGSYSHDGLATNYFQLVDVGASDRLGDLYWRQIKSNERLFEVIDSISDKYEGNNPHSGNYQYDDGEEYLNRFRKLFKYAYENKYFDESCFSDVDESYEEISGYGFSNIESYIKDEKVHAFLDTYDTSGNTNLYDINEKSSLSAITGYDFVKNVANADGVTSQIINTKRIKITFYVDGLYDKEEQEYIKYIQSKIVPYVEQMIPSSSIVTIAFNKVCQNVTEANEDSGLTPGGNTPAGGGGTLPFEPGIGVITPNG